MGRVEYIIYLKNNADLGGLKKMGIHLKIGSGIFWRRLISKSQFLEESFECFLNRFAVDFGQFVE